MEWVCRYDLLLSASWLVVSWFAFTACWFVFAIISRSVFVEPKYLFFSFFFLITLLRLRFCGKSSPPFLHLSCVDSGRPSLFPFYMGRNETEGRV